MIEILIARHGQSIGDVEHRFEGRADNARYPLPKEPLMPHEPTCFTGESLLDFRFRAEKFISELILEFDKGYSPPRILIISWGNDKHAAAMLVKTANNT